MCLQKDSEPDETSDVEEELRNLLDTFPPGPSNQPQPPINNVEMHTDFPEPNELNIKQELECDEEMFLSGDEYYGDETDEMVDIKPDISTLTPLISEPERIIIIVDSSDEDINDPEPPISQPSTSKPPPKILGPVIVIDDDDDDDDDEPMPPKVQPTPRALRAVQRRIRKFVQRQLEFRKRVIRKKTSQPPKLPPPEDEVIVVDDDSAEEATPSHVVKMPVPEERGRRKKNKPRKRPQVSQDNSS